MAECYFRKITTAGDQNNNGAVCMPFLGYNSIASQLPLLKYTKLQTEWPNNYQCLTDKCGLQTKAYCAANGFNCVCNDTCPLGKVRLIEDLSYLIPCSGRGVCRANGECLCYNGYISNNCEIHCSETVGGCCLSNFECTIDKECISKNAEGIGYCS